MAEDEFPTPRQEDWKYTDFSALGQQLYTPSVAAPGKRPATEDVDGAVMLFVNGRLDENSTDLTQLPPGVSVVPLQAGMTQPAEVWSERVGTQGPSDYFTNLNTALFNEGVLVRIEADCVVTQPLYLRFATEPAATASDAHARIVIVMEADSQATIIESYEGEPSPYLRTAVTEAWIGDGARLEHVRLSLDPLDSHHVGRVWVRQAAGSTYLNHSFCLGDARIRNDLTVTFDGPGAQAYLNGLFFGTRQQHVDNHTTVDHKVPQCSSHQLYKGVLDGTSRGVFHGRVYIRPDAQGSNAEQHNPNLILSRGALVDSTPALEIEADDVKARHGSTIGRLDRAAIFYLRSRGIDEATAKSLLTYGFAKEVIDRVPVAALAQRLSAIVLARLPNGQVVKEALDGAGF